MCFVAVGTSMKMECYIFVLLLTVSMQFLFSTCVDVHAEATASSDVSSILKHQQQRDCPMWFYFDSETQSCRCLSYYGARCFDNKAYLFAGFCATYDEETDVIFLSVCPYHGFVYSQHDIDWYIQLPDNISTLNDYMCSQLNRKGRVCSECMDGYGHSVTSIGFQYFECSNCSNAWYGIPLYLLLEFVPITLFYLVILILQVNITSAPMTCYILYSQLTVVAYDSVYGGDDPKVRDVLLLVGKHSELWFSFVMTVYDVWNLRFLRYLLPPFCINESLKQIHLSFLGCVSIFYPLCLMALTWVCVELHGRRFRPLVYLWQLFHRFFVHIRSEWDITCDLVNVFASFFLLSFTKVMYQTVLLLVSRKQKAIQYDHGSLNYLRFMFVVGADESVVYGSTEHLVFLIPLALFCCVFFVLPASVLILYPFGITRVFLSKCHLDRIALKFFVEKFYSCYKDGLDGGCDMRSFAGLYFVVRIMLLCTNVVGGVIGVAKNDPYFWRNAMLAVAVLLIAICRPYKQTYMNVLDILLLTYLGLVCHLMSAEHSFSVRKNVAYTFDVMLAFPFFCFILFFIVKTIKKVVSCKWHICRLISKKCKYCFSPFEFQIRRFIVQRSRLRSNSPSNEQVLIDPFISYGTY